MELQMDDQKKNKKKIKRWQISLLVIAGIIIGIFAVLVVRINSKREPELATKNTGVVSKESTFQVQLTKSQTNELLNYYLNEFQKDSKVKYSFVLENQALLQGTFPFMGHDLIFYLYFEPTVTDGGNVQLKAKSISIGTLSLPISELMKYVKTQFKLPAWVIVNSKDEIIELHLNEFQLKGGMYLGAEKIDLLGDEIKFNVFLPTKK